MKLNTDNAQTMPITAAVYGPKAGKPKDKVERARPAERPLYRLLPELAVLRDSL